MFCKSYYAGIRLMSYIELFKDFLIFISVSIHYEIAQHLTIKVFDISKIQRKHYNLKENITCSIPS